MAATLSRRFSDLDSRFDAVLVRSISLGDGIGTRTTSRSLSFNGCDSKPSLMRSFGSAKMLIESSLRINPSSEMDKSLFGRSVTLKTRNDEPTRLDRLSERASFPESGVKRHQAAVKLQKVYKSFRTRRQLADCAVVVEQRWWKLLDFAELKRSSISFFDIEKPESAFQRWSRARTRAAKVGKGLSKDEKARKLALQHWLEAIDPRHRYGHNLQFYYVNWLHCQSQQPFFYWLDIGEGKEVNLERCLRSKLQQQCIKYLGPTERKTYEVVVENGRFLYKQSGKVLDTTGGPKDAKWIFVLSTLKTLYVGTKNKGTFQHSSFLAGGATLSAGRLVVEDGILKAVWPHSGHYLPTEENFQEFMSFLKEHNVDVATVQKSPTEEAMAQENMESTKQDPNAAGNFGPQESKLSIRLPSQNHRLKIPMRDDVLNSFNQEEVRLSSEDEPPLTPPVQDDGYVSAEDSFLTEEDFIFPKYNLFEDDEEGDKDPIPKEIIMKRIDSHKGMNSYQLAKQLSSKWTTGAGPRIGCMRDYPSELQFRVLEQAQLSPKSSSPKDSTPNLLRRETMCSKSPLAKAK